MRKIPAFFMICFALASTPSIAQNTEAFNKIYNTQTIYQSGNKYMKGNQRLTYHDLATEFTTPRTQDLYRKSRKKLVLSRVFNVASLGLIVAAILTKTTVSGSIKFAVGTGLTGLGSAYFLTESSKYVQQAIWERNRDVLDAGLQPTSSN